jgi:hypothetical protein
MVFPIRARALGQIKEKVLIFCRYLGCLTTSFYFSIPFLHRIFDIVAYSYVFLGYPCVIPI